MNTAASAATLTTSTFRLSARLRSGLRTIALATSLTAMTASAFAADTRFALTCIGTAVGQSINFHYRWGSSDPWKLATADSGQWVVLTYTYDYLNENRSPTLQIRYDDDFSSDTHFAITDLKSYAAANRYCEGEGYLYNFHLRGLELYVAERGR